MGCCGEKKGFVATAMSVVKAVTSGHVDKADMDDRLALCILCKDVDAKGVRLLRIHNTALYCGEPRLHSIRRVESEDGCGCNLHSKVRYKESKCPRGYW